MLEARDRVGGRVLSHDLSRRHRRRGRRAVDRARRSSGWRSSPPSSGSRPSPRTTTGRAPAALRRRAGPLPGRPPAAQPAGARRHGQAQARFDRLPTRCRSTRRGPPTAPDDLDDQTFETWIRAQRPHREGSLSCCASTPRRCSPPRRRTSRCCTRSSTRTRAAASTRSPAPTAARSRIGSSAARSSCRSRSPSSSATAVRLGARRSGASSSAATRVTVLADGVAGHRPARDRRGAARARRPHRVRPAAARLPRPAHAAGAAGLGIKCNVVYDRRSGATTASPARRPATTAR